MAILQRQFFYHERGNHDEKWYSLCRDTDTGDVFILHEWAERANVGERRLTVREFMGDTTSAQSKFLTLIGTLATEPAPA